MASRNTAVIKLVGDNDDLRKKLSDSERRVKGLERAVGRTKKSTKGAFSPLAESAHSALGPLGGLTRKLHQAANGSKGIKGIGSAAKGSVGPLAMAGAAVAGLGVAAGVLGGAVNKLKSLSAETRKLNRETGMTMETSSAWIGIADRMGISSGKLSQSFGILSKGIHKVTAGDKGSEKMAGDFEALGVSFDTLKSGNMDQILMQTAEGFSKMADGSDKTALSMRLFGRGGKDLLPILNKGSGGIKDLKGEMKALGLTIGDKTTTQVKDLGVAQNTLRQVWSGMQIQLASKVVPWISKFAVKFKDLVVQWRTGHGTGGKLKVQFEKIKKATVEAWKAIQPLVVAIGKFIADHPGVVKMVAGLIAFKLAMKGVGFLTPISQARTFIGVLSTLGKTKAGSKAASALTSPFKNFGTRMARLGRQGATGLASTFTRLAQSGGSKAYNNLAGAFSRIGTRFGRLGTTAGRALGNELSSRASYVSSSGLWASLRSGRLKDLVKKGGLFSRFGNSAGRIAGKGAAIGMILGLYSIVKSGPLKRYSGKKGWGNLFSDIAHGVWDSWISRNLPGLANGGIVNGARMAMVGEAGPEAIIPLSLNRRARGQELFNQAGAILGMNQPNAAVRASSMTFNVVNNGNQMDEQVLASKIAWQLQTRGL